MNPSNHDAASEKLRAENDELRRRLAEAEDALRAIREGEVDAIIVSGTKGDRVFSLAETENLHRIMVETMNEAGIATSPDGTILYCNHRACALLQRAASELMGQHLSEFVAPQDLERSSLLLDNASRGTTQDRIMFLAADESPVPMQLWASHAETLEGPMVMLVGTDLSLLDADQALGVAPLLDGAGKVRGAVAAFNNITSHMLTKEDLRRAVMRRDELVKELEQAQRLLRESHLALEEQVKERTLLSEERGEKLRSMADALTAAEQEERRRLAQVLHDDLQQMLVAIRLRLSSLESNAAGTSLAPAVHSIGEIVDNAITSARSLTVELSPPILREPLARIIEWLGSWFDERHNVLVHVTVDEGIREPAEEAKKFLFQAVRELILNVRKHGQTDEAFVRIFPDGDNVGIEVRDAGAGFDTALLKSSARASFGLFSIRDRVDLMGGSLDVQSVPGRGTTCTVRVPAPALPPAVKPSPAATDVTQTATDDNERGGPIRVIVVDDHTIFRRGLISILESCPDIKVVGEASDGEEGVTRAGELLPDVVIMDLAMPRMNGIEATRMIKSRFQSVDVIALSFQESEHARSSVLQAGAKAYFTKSGPLDELLHAIRTHTRMQSGAAPRYSSSRKNGGGSFVAPARPKEPRRASNPLPEKTDASRRAPSRTRKA